MSFRFPTPRLPTRRQTNPFYLPSSTDHVIDALLHLSSCLVSSRYPPTSVRLCTTLRLIIITPNTGCRRASPLNPSSCFLSYLFPLLSLPTFLRRLQLRTRLCRHPLPSLTQSTTDLVGYIPVPVTPNNLNQFPVSPPPPPTPTRFTRCLRYLFRPRLRAEAQSASVYRVVEFSSPPSPLPSSLR